MNERGFFLTIEGIDGSGKSTQARLLAKRLGELGRTVVETREPGGAPGAEEIRRLLVSGDPDRWSPATEILLFTAARRDHAERVIEPALDRGAVVLCDRFVDSTRAYQGAGASELRVLVDQLHRLAIGIDPDLTLVFDMDPVVALERARSRGSKLEEDRFEKMGPEFQARLRAEFLAICAGEPVRCAMIDASRPAEAVAAQVWATVAPRLGLAS
jgi:dTMP kinase